MEQIGPAARTPAAVHNIESNECTLRVGFLVSLVPIWFQIILLTYTHDISKLVLVLIWGYDHISS